MSATYVIHKMYVVTCVLRDSESEREREGERERERERESEREDAYG